MFPPDSVPTIMKQLHIRKSSAKKAGFEEPKPRLTPSEVYQKEQKILRRYGRNPERHNQRKFKKGETLEINVVSVGETFTLELIDLECRRKHAPPVSLLEEIVSGIDIPPPIADYGCKPVIFGHPCYTNIKFNVTTDEFSGSYEYYAGNMIGKIAYDPQEHAIIATPTDEDASDHVIDLVFVFGEAFKTSETIMTAESSH